ncbi:MAG: dihydroneopterin aldolase [Kiritimatiellae bacterium]|nr:dihydroneopterin aldolase [Kiritimatiellia bacterium]
MTLNLNKMKVVCILGDLPEEREQEREIEVDISLTGDFAAAESDRLEDTVDYVELKRKVEAKLIASKCRMIERAAKIIKELCLEEKFVDSATVKITKRGAIEGLESASAIC